jgi:hypothetical protein
MRREIVYRPPAEPIADAPTRPLGDVARAIVAAAFVMLLLGSGPLLKWTEELPVNPITDRLAIAVETWHGAMTDLGLARFHPWLKGEIERLTKR